MPSNPFKSLTGKNSCTLFEIRLDDDFIIFRGNDHEAAGQLLKGTVVLCLQSALRVEDIHLRLTGQLRLAWTDAKSTPSGISHQKVDRSRIIFTHRWEPFVSSGSSSRSTMLKPGNYEWPFELLLDGTMAESVEGLPETSLTYKLKATIARGKLAYDLHAYKHLRIIRTLEPAALEFLHAMSVENVWVNKVEYSIVIPQKAAVFGGIVSLDMRFTPLLKGLEMGDIAVKLMEIHDLVWEGPFGNALKEHRSEREIETWKLNVNRAEHWQDVMEETGQEGWVVHAPLHLPKRLRECVQDVNTSSIRIKHKLRLNVALKNPDGHVSELRATLPITIFISPNMLLDDQGNIIRQQPGVVSSIDVAIAPPGYGEHILDQLYDDMATPGFQSPLQSGMNSPFYSQSRAGSVENLASLAGNVHNGVAPAALTSRLQSMAAGGTISNSNSSSLDQIANAFNIPSTDLSRRTSNEDDDMAHTRMTGFISGRHTPEHVDFPALEDLSRVPSYGTAVRSSGRNFHSSCRNAPPDYQSAISMSTPTTPGYRSGDQVTDPMETIHEVTSADALTLQRRRRGSASSSVSGHSTHSGNSPIYQTAASSPGNSMATSSRPSFLGRRRATSMGLSFFNNHSHTRDDEARRVHLIQAREQVM